MQIKFRVRNALTKEVVGHEFIGENGWWYFQPINGAVQIGVLSNHTDFFREQFTGRKDSAGVEIYYNDIVHCAHPRYTYGTHAKIGFNGTDCCFDLREYREGYGFDWDVITINEDSNLLIVGDIYQLESDPALIPGDPLIAAV